MKHWHRPADNEPHRHNLQVVASTLLSGASGCIAQLVYRAQAATGIRALNAAHDFSKGARAAIVACAASCTVVPLWTHLITGPLASIVSDLLDHFMWQTSGIDDTTAIVPIHLGGGALGLLAVGFFGDAVCFPLCRTKNASYQQ